jgi:hypothetical protein
LLAAICAASSAGTAFHSSVLAKTDSSKAAMSVRSSVAPGGTDP